MDEFKSCIGYFLRSIIVSNLLFILLKSTMLEVKKQRNIFLLSFQCFFTRQPEDLAVIY